MFENDNQEPAVNQQEPINESFNPENNPEALPTEPGDLEGAAPSDVNHTLAEAQEKYLRLYADFENYKRRTSKERIEMMLMANQEMISAILPVLDDFERAQKSIQMATDIQAIQEGVNLVQSKLLSVLQQKGLKSFDAVGAVFNSDLHEAITEIPVSDDAQKGKVVDEVEKGYMLGEKVIRYAKVVVGS